MRIGLLAPITLPVPPEGYGGTERVVQQLADGLVARGHHVTLFASGDSRTAARLVTKFPRSLGPQATRAEVEAAEAEHAAFAMANAGDLDLMHDHLKLQGILAAQQAPVPVVTTVHNDLTPARREAYGAFPRHRFVALSESHARRMPELNWAGMVYNGLDLAPTVFQEQKGSYVLFIGRLDEVKGAHTAARLAQAMDLELVMAGRLEQPFFDEQVAPYLDGVKRRYVGELSGRAKWECIAGAQALLFPIQWEEPFGLVMIEAMACGTPVVAFDRGAVPEVVQHNHSGIVVNPAAGLTGLAAGLRAARLLSPRDCRTHVERRFSSARMVERYEALYREVLSSEAIASA